MTGEKDKKFQVEEQILIDSEWIRNIIAGNQNAFEISDNTEKQIILEKGFAVSLSSKGNITKPKPVDIDSYISWINGKISFDDVHFSEILAQAERGYNVRFSLGDSTFIKDRLTVSIYKTHCLMCLIY